MGVWGFGRVGVVRGAAMRVDETRDRGITLLLQTRQPEPGIALRSEDEGHVVWAWHQGNSGDATAWGHGLRLLASCCVEAVEALFRT